MLLPRIIASSSGGKPGPNLVEFHAGVQPRTVGAEKEFVRTRSPDRLYDVVKATYAGCIGVHVGIADKLIYHLLLRPPVVSEAAQVGDDKVDPEILGATMSIRSARPTTS